MTLDDLRADWRDEMTQQSKMSHDDLQSIAKDVAKVGRDVRLRDFWFVAALVVAAGLGSFFGCSTMCTIGS